MNRIRCKNILAGGKPQEGYIYFDGGKIVSVTREGELPFDGELDTGDCYCAAGFIDVHTHGAVGADFTFCSKEGAIRAVNFHAQHGTTAILPTTLASDYESTAAALRTLQAAQQSGEAKAQILGVHIEGPYFSPQMAGAQNPEYFTDPVEKDYLRILDEFGSFVKKWSYAPERDRYAQFCRTLFQRGVFASARHTNAVYLDMAAAFVAGLKGVTHLYSCTSTITREKGYRRLGVIECAYLFRDLYAELIADGRHIPPELIRLVFEQKGAEHVMLVTDSLSVTGSEEKEGVLNGVPYLVEDRVAKLSDGSAFAGSLATMDMLVRECVRAGVPLEQAVRAASETPARALGLKKGKIVAGYDADFVLLDKELRVQKTIVGGKL